MAASCDTEREHGRNISSNPDADDLWMLPASWALLRSSRSLLGIGRQLRSIRAAGTRHGATLTLQQAHTNLEREQPSPATHTEFPIDVLNTQSTLRTLEELIEAGQHDEALNVMSDFFTSSAIDIRLDAFHRLRVALLKAPEDNLDLLIGLARGYAALGHSELVKESILPVIRQMAPPQLRSHIELYLRLSSSDASTIPSGALDSASASEELSLIFEDEGEEYAAHQPTASASNHSGFQSSGALVKMVEAGHYKQAYTLLKEMEELGASIPPSAAFVDPANAVLQDPKVSSDDKVEQFAAWFTHIPPAHAMPATHDFQDTRRLVLQSHTIHVALLIRFALILARKGYADNMSMQVVPHVVRCTNQRVGLTFLQDFLKANVHYLLEFNIRNPGFRMKKTATNVHGIAVRALCYSGRVTEAVALLPDLNNPSFKLTTYTYNVVLRRLRASSREVRDKYMEKVKKLRDEDLTAIPLPRSNIETLRALSQEHDFTSNMGADTAGPIDFGNNLVAMLRYLKKHITSEEKHELPHPFTLVNFMSLYLSTGRTRALKMLLDKALGKSFIAASNFAFAEMLFYRRLHQPNLVIQTFVDHFFLSGVPRSEVLIRVTRADSQYRNYDPSSGEEPPLRRFYPFNSSFTLPKGKIWPGRIHCNLVWDALAELTTQPKELEVLYYKLIQYAEEGKDQSEPASILAIADQVPIPSNWHTAVGAAAFTPFIYRLMHARGPEFGVKMIRDMLQLGIKPTVYHYTELAGFYARKGDTRRVFTILDGMEQGETQPFGKETYSLQKKRSTAEPIKEHSLPEPTLVTYVCLIRGFLIGRDLEAAEEVAKRLALVHDHIPGENQHLDSVLRDLEGFRRDGEYWVCPLHSL